MKTKIAFIVPIVAHYRLTFFEKLVNLDAEIEWCIFHGKKKLDDGRPGYTGELSFPNVEYKPNFFNVGPFEIVYNTGLISAIKNFNPDVIITTGISGDITNQLLAKWCRRNNKRLILWVCSWDSGRSNSVLRRIKMFYVKRYFSRASQFIAYGSHANNYIRNLGFERDRISIAYNGLDLNLLKEAEEKVLNNSQKLRSEFDKEGRDTIFLYVGGLREDKKVEYLIDNFKILQQEQRNIQLWIVGDGPEYEKLRALSSYNSSIYLFGRVTKGVDDFFSACDFFVLPGAGGLALNQAMFWRKPCIVGFADGTEDDLILDGISGFRFCSDNEVSLLNSLKHAVNLSNDEKKKLGDNARKIVEEKSNIDKMLSVFINVVDSIKIQRA